MSARSTAEDDQKLIDTLDAVVREHPLTYEIDGETVSNVVSEIDPKGIGSFDLGDRKVVDVVGERIGRTGAAVAGRLRKLDNVYTCSTSGMRWMRLTKPTETSPVEMTEAEATDPTWEDLVRRGQVHVDLMNSRPWWLGDLACEVETSYGEASLSRYAEEIGISYSTLRSYKATAQAWPRSVGRPTSYTVAERLAAQEDRQALIAAQPDMTAREARQIGRDRKPKPVEPPSKPAPAPEPSREPEPDKPTRPLTLDELRKSDPDIVALLGESKKTKAISAYVRRYECGWIDARDFIVGAHAALPAPTPPEPEPDPFDQAADTLEAAVAWLRKIDWKSLSFEQREVLRQRMSKLVSLTSYQTVSAATARKWAKKTQPTSVDIDYIMDISSVITKWFLFSDSDIVRRIEFIATAGTYEETEFEAPVRDLVRTLDSLAGKADKLRDLVWPTVGDDPIGIERHAKWRHGDACGMCSHDPDQVHPAWAERVQRVHEEAEARREQFRDRQAWWEAAQEEHNPFRFEPEEPKPVFSERADKLLALAMENDNDHEAMLAFQKARAAHQKEKLGQQEEPPRATRVVRRPVSE